MFHIRFFLTCFLFFASSAWTYPPLCNYFTTDYQGPLPEECWFPTSFNNILSVGYFSTPSARMAKTGELGIGYTYVPPYNNYMARAQPFPYLSLSYVYRGMRGYQDPNRRITGPGDDHDSGANFKFALTLPEDSCYGKPGLAFGVEDFFGTQLFRNTFIVGSYVLKNIGLETSLGWGTGIYTGGPSLGWFGGAAWYPFWKKQNSWFQKLGVIAEYDPINYDSDPHPNGINVAYPVNFGLKYTLFDSLQLSVSQMRGNTFSGSAVLNANFGKMEGFLKKSQDPPLYCAEPLGCSRPEKVFSKELFIALKKQGIGLNKIGREGKMLVLHVENCQWRRETTFRNHLQSVLKCLVPKEFECVKVVLEAHTLPVQEYTFSRELLEELVKFDLSGCEMERIVPRKDFNRPILSPLSTYYSYPIDSLQYSFLPIYNAYFGEDSWKFLYDLRLNASFWGDLPKQLYYAWGVNWSAISNIDPQDSQDPINASQLPQVATDLVRYFEVHSVTWNNLYLQKLWNMRNALFATATLGYFQVNYAGLAGEFLYYPAHGRFGFGIEGAVVKKRSYRGLGFQNTLTQFNGTEDVSIPYTTLQQYFVDCYLTLPAMNLFAKTSLGKFLAGDMGAYIEIVKFFDNGLRLGGFFTFTDANDQIYGNNYYNRGIILEIPFDFIMQKSCRSVYTYSSAVWLRDAGYRTTTGLNLFDLVERERRR